MCVHVSVCIFEMPEYITLLLFYEWRYIQKTYLTKKKGVGGEVNNSSTWRCVDTAAGIRASNVFVFSLYICCSQPHSHFSTHL